LMSISCLLLASFAAMASDTGATAFYADGAVTVSGTGFEAGGSYIVRVVDTVNISIKAMSQTTADGNGNLSVSITTGSLETPENYKVYINRLDGSIAATIDTIECEGEEPS